MLFSLKSEIHPVQRCGIKHMKNLKFYINTGSYKALVDLSSAAEINL